MEFNGVRLEYDATWGDENHDDEPKRSEAKRSREEQSRAEQSGAEVVDELGNPAPKVSERERERKCTEPISCCDANCAPVDVMSVSVSGTTNCYCFSMIYSLARADSASVRTR